MFSVYCQGSAASGSAASPKENRLKIDKTDSGGLRGLKTIPSNCSIPAEHV